MKKNIVRFISSTTSRLGNMVICVAFLASFMQVTTQDVLVLESLAKEHVPDKFLLADTVKHARLSDYGWPYGVYMVHYKDHTDTIVTIPGTPPLVLENVIWYESCTKFMDNWMITWAPAKGYSYGEWIPSCKNTPKDKKQTIALKNLQEFKPEQPLILSGIAGIRRNGMRSEDYFNQMRTISNITDKQIHQEVFNPLRPQIMRNFFQERKGKPKLRPFLTHAAYAAGGRKRSVPKLYALQELQTMALYCDNWIIDNKKAEIPRSELTIASSLLQLEAERLISHINLSLEKKEEFRFRFNFSNRLSYEGQLLDTRLQEGHLSIMYEQRCSLLNAPYAFSLWSGGYMAGMEKSLTAALWTAGMALGTGLQMINDTYDLSPKNPNRFADLRAGKVTLPYYLESQATGTAEEKAETMKKEMREKILVCHKDAVNALKCLPNNQGKQLIIQAFDILVTSKLLT